MHNIALNRNTTKPTPTLLLHSMLKGLNSTIKDLDSKGRIVVAANAFGNVDADRDVSMPGSFVKTIKENFARVKWFLNHDRTQLLGVPLSAEETKDYLQVVGQLNLEKQIGKDTYEDYKLYADYGKSLEHSIGVDPIKYIEDRENNVRKVSEWKWWEYSTLTSWGANERTPMLSMKSASLNSDLDWLEIRMKKGNYTDETFMQIEQSISRIKSLINQQQKGLQPISADALANVSKQFIQTL